MGKGAMSRRGFIRDTSIVAAAGIVANGAVLGAAEDSGNRVRLGGPVKAASADPEEIALAHVKVGYRAAYCPDVELEDEPRIKAVAAAFAKHDVVIAEVGRWCNLLDADPEKRRANLETVTRGLALAEAVGARCCVDIAGSYSTENWFGPHPKNLSREFFDAAVENARKIIDAVNPARAKFCYEMMGWAIPDSCASYAALIRAVDRPGFGAHLDPCNLINCPQRFYENTAMLNECFDTLGPWITSCHAKDLTWDVEMNIHFREVCPGDGALDYATYLRRIAKLPQPPPLMIEHMPDMATYDKARAYIMKAGADCGVRFG